MKNVPWLPLWRVAVLALLAWGILELRWTREEMPVIPWDLGSTLSDIRDRLAP